MAQRKRGPSTPTRFTDKHRRKSEPKPHRMGYPTDLTDKEWAILDTLLKEAGVGTPRNNPPSLRSREALWLWTVTPPVASSPRAMVACTVGAEVLRVAGSSWPD